MNQVANRLSLINAILLALLILSRAIDVIQTSTLNLNYEANLMIREFGLPALYIINLLFVIVLVVGYVLSWRWQPMQIGLLIFLAGVCLLSWGVVIGNIYNPHPFIK